MGVSQEDPWAKVPHWVVESPELEASAIRVYCVLSKHANRDRDAFPGIRKIAEEGRLATTTVRKAIDQLEAIGAIVVTRRKTAAGKWRANHYHLPLNRAVPIISGSTTGPPPEPLVGQPLDHPGPTVDPPSGPTVDTEQEELPNKNHSLASAEPETTKAEIQPRPRNPWWDALAAVMQYQPDETERKIWGLFVAERQREGLDPSEIPIRAERLVRQWGFRTLTVASLRKHWRRFGGPIGAATEADTDRAVEALARARRRAEIELAAHMLEGGVTDDA